MHRNTREKSRKAILHWLEAEVRADYWTRCLPTEFTIRSHFSSLSLFLSLSYSTSSLSPFLSTKRSAACQGCKLLTPPFLVSKQVILFSIPVSAETVIICPLKRSHTHSVAMLEKPAREIVEADLAEKITSDLLQQTQKHQQQHISSFSFLQKLYEDNIWRRAGLKIYIVIRQGRL